MIIIYFFFRRIENNIPLFKVAGGVSEFSSSKVNCKKNARFFYNLRHNILFIFAHNMM